VVELLARAKVTLSLRVTGVRPDGYHTIDAEMVAVDLHDRLLVAPVPAGSPPELRVLGPEGPRPTDRHDLVLRALDRFDRPASVTLEKRIPAGAGLGGGSADAAAVLRWIGRDDPTALDPAVAAELGADVPFCVVGGRARVTGIGELVEPLPHVDGVLTLATPPLHCSTPVVYRTWDELGGPRGDHGNDLEPAALAAYPELTVYRDRLEQATGCRPRLAGSGSTWFVEGAFPGPGRVVVRTVADGGT